VSVVSRRDFLSTTSAGGLAWPLMRHFDLAWQPRREQASPRPLVTFEEAGFPLVDVPSLPLIPNARAMTSSDELLQALTPDAVLVWRHGSAFPAEAWHGIYRFLEGGGNLLYIGGEPWTRPVTGGAGRRRVEPRTVAQLQALRLNQSYRVGAAGALVQRPGVPVAGARVLSADTWIAALEPRFSDTTDFAFESGSPGARDALLRPLAFAQQKTERFPFAAIAYAIDRLRGPFAGGRWVLWLASTPPVDEMSWLLEEAARRPVDLRVDPTFGCFHPGEQPSLILRAHRPGATDALTIHCAVAVPEAGAAYHAELPVTEHGTVRFPLPGTFAPGLHRVTVDAGSLGRATTGFWVFDMTLFESGDALTFDDYTLRRNGHPEPIVGTTTMSATVHRDFLFEPNAAVWDDTFAELSSLQVNAIRTGLWSGWRKISLDANVVDESVLRALEAFYLTARKHQIPIIFSVFAFAPEEFGGADPYLDPRALDGQRAFLTALASRLAPAREFIWDLINEPSFESTRSLWSLRPARSPFERRAFLAWLEKRYQPSNSAGTWEDVVRRRWRLRPDEGIDLPEDEDFSDAWVFGARRPYRALDYALFAQDAFEQWIGKMTGAIRAGGHQGAITVGQDEAGLGTSPSPLFHHTAVAFTSMHTWWNNDALLWDGVLSKATGTPLLISETGIMQRQKLSGEAIRTPDEFAALLSRKIAYAFASGAFGVIQWCYDANPFMNSDNEAAIGLKRVDGSAKPEHGVLASAAAFVARNRTRFEGYIAPDVALIVPTSEQLSPRSLASVATRNVIRAFYEELGIPVRAVAEHCAARDLGAPRVIVMPASRSIADAAWQAVSAAVDAGAMLVCSGWFETDDAGLAAERLNVPPRPLSMIEEMADLDSTAASVFRFGTTMPESWPAADVPAPRRLARGRGTIVHHPLPIEWAEPSAALGRFYATALKGTGVDRKLERSTSAHGVVSAALPFRDAWLVVAVNESSRSQRVDARRPGTTASVTFDVDAGRGRMAFVDPRAWRLIDVW
jgi:hypothetical protein